MKIQTNQKGIAHIQILLLIPVVVSAVGLVYWRVSQNSQKSSVSSSLSQEDIKTIAGEAKLIDEDHDLIPLCTVDITENCENETEDQDFDNDGLIDSKDSDDDNDGKPDESDDDQDHDGIDDSKDSDDDSDGLEDSEDPDDDNDGDRSDETKSSNSGRGSTSSGSSDDNDDSSDDNEDDSSDENEVEDESEDDSPDDN